MTDKEKIRQEILRRVEETPSTEGVIALESLLDYINSISEESTSEDLEEYYTKEFLPKEWFAKPGHRTISQFNFFTAHHFAEWQKQKDRETIELAEDHAMLAGMNKMKEEMMENAVETTIVNDWQYGKDPDHSVIPAIHQRIEGFNVGDKVKIIIVKNEQQ